MLYYFFDAHEYEHDVNNIVIKIYYNCRIVTYILFILWNIKLFEINWILKNKNSEI